MTENSTGSAKQIGIKKGRGKGGPAANHRGKKTWIKEGLGEIWVVGVPLVTSALYQTAKALDGEKKSQGGHSLLVVQG